MSSNSSNVSAGGFDAKSYLDPAVQKDADDVRVRNGGNTVDLHTAGLHERDPGQYAPGYTVVATADGVKIEPWGAAYDSAQVSVTDNGYTVTSDAPGAEQVADRLLASRGTRQPAPATAAVRLQQAYDAALEQPPQALAEQLSTAADHARETMNDAGYTITDVVLHRENPEQQPLSDATVRILYAPAERDGRPQRPGEHPLPGDTDSPVIALEPLPDPDYSEAVATQAVYGMGLVLLQDTPQKPAVDTGIPYKPRSHPDRGQAADRSNFAVVEAFDQVYDDIDVRN